MKILFIPDPHIPYTRLDLWEKIHTYNKKFRADKVLCAGDFFDNYALSKYIKSPRGDTSHTEILRCIPQVKQIKKWFPKIEIIPGNHCGRIQKRATEAGISDMFLRDQLEVVGAPKGWKWADGDTVTYDGVVFTHGWLSDPKRHAEFFNQSCAHGHLHSKVGITFIARGNRVIHNTCVGFLGDTDQLALQYGPIRYNTGVHAFATFTDGRPHIEVLDA